MLREDTSFFFLINSLFFVFFCYFTSLLIFTKIILLLLFYYIFFSWKLFLFFHVLECSGMFHVPGFIDVPKMVCEGLSKISSNFTFHLLKVGKLKRFKKVSSDLKTIFKTDLAHLRFLSFEKGEACQSINLNYVAWENRFK